MDCPPVTASRGDSAGNDPVLGYEFAGNPVGQKTAGGGQAYPRAGLIHHALAHHARQTVRVDPAAGSGVQMIDVQPVRQAHPHQDAFGDFILDRQAGFLMPLWTREVVARPASGFCGQPSTGSETPETAMRSRTNADPVSPSPVEPVVNRLVGV